MSVQALCFVGETFPAAFNRLPQPLPVPRHGGGHCDGGAASDAGAGVCGAVLRHRAAAKATCRGSGGGVEVVVVVVVDVVVVAEAAAAGR